MTKALSTLPVGALVKDINTRYSGAVIIWKIADQNHEGYPANSTTLITDKIISLKCVDAIEASSSDVTRRSYGNNRYIYSNIRRWLNSQAGAGAWYAAQHSTDAPPTNANVLDNKNEYDQEAGFLAGFSANMRAALLSTTHTVGKASVDGGGTETCADKIFLASSTEVGLSGDVVCGSKLALFSNDTSLLAYPTAECVSKSEYRNSSFNTGAAWHWWLCDAYAPNSYNVRFVNSSGALGWNNAYRGFWGVRPLCNLSSSILVSDTADSDGVYTLFIPGLYVKQNGEWNKARGVSTMAHLETVQVNISPVADITVHYLDQSGRYATFSTRAATTFTVIKNSILHAFSTGGIFGGGDNLIYNNSYYYFFKCTNNLEIHSGIDAS